MGPRMLVICLVLASTKFSEANASEAQVSALDSKAIFDALDQELTRTRAMRLESRSTIGTRRSSALGSPALQSWSRRVTSGSVGFSITLARE